MQPPSKDATLGEVLRCLIVDDNAAFLDAATSLLEREGITVVGRALNIAAALRCTDELQPNVVLVDVQLGPESGFDLARRLSTAHPDVTVILISTHAEADFADLIERTPAAGFVPKYQLSAAAIERLAAEK